MLRDLKVVHEDADLIVVDKPAGILSADVTGQGGMNVFDAIKDRYRARRNRGDRVYIIHRLDRGASGLLVFAISTKAFHWLKEDFRAKRVHRLYVGLCEGEWPASASGMGTSIRSRAGGAKSPAMSSLPVGSVQTFLQEDAMGVVQVVSMGEAASTSAKRRFALEEDFEGPHPTDAKPAVTHYRVMAMGRGLSLVQFRLETGRKNQIRAHMQHIGHPLSGDSVYGAKGDPIGRLGLHAVELGFTHPATGQAVRYRSEMPESFSKAIGKSATTIDASASSSDTAQAASPSAYGQPTALQPPASTEHAKTLSSASSSPTASPAARDPLSLPPGSAASTSTTASSATKPREGASASDEGRPTTSWDHVAGWYDRLIGEQLTDHYAQVIMPGAMRLLNAQRGMRLLDVACGQGVLCRAMSEIGVDAVGVDASTRLIATARQLEKSPRAGTRGVRGHVEYLVGDARDLPLALGSLEQRARGAAGAQASGFDAAACIMALMNIDPLEPVVRGVASVLKPGGAFIAVLLHPAFRSPGQTGWGWEKREGGPDVREGSTNRARSGSRDSRDGRRGPGGGNRGAGRPSDDVRQYRRVDGYLSSSAMPIVMNPGKAAAGHDAVTTWTFHRPIQTYVRTLADAGLLVERLEEWPSQRESEPGPRSAEENRARREIPMFLGLRAVKVR